MNICLILRPPRGRPGNRLADAGPKAPRVVADRNPLVRFDFGALALDLHPAGCHTDLVVAQHVVGDAVAVRTAVRPRVLERGREAAAQDDVERDRGVLVGVEADLDVTQRFDHAVVDRPDVGARGVRRQPASGAYRPLFGAAAYSGRTVEHTTVGVLSDPEDDLQRVVARVRDRPDLLGPRRIRLADGGEGVDDLVREKFVLGHQPAVVRRQQGSYLSAVSARPPANVVMSIPRSYSPIQVSAQSGSGWSAGS